MGWSYDSALSADRDKVRLYIGDTTDADQLLQDEEIDFLISSEGSAKSAAIAACLSIAAKFSRLADKSVDDLSVSYSQRASNYRELAKTIGGTTGVMAGASIPVPYAGGIRDSDKDIAEADPDAVVPIFSHGMHRVNGSGYFDRKRYW